MKNIKKLTSVILAVALIFAMSSIVFAAPGSGTPIGTESEQTRFVNKAMESYWEDRSDDVEWIRSTENPNWNYRILEDGTIRVGTYGHSSETAPVVNNIVVPSTLDGKTVTEIRRIGDYSTLSIEIPEGITQIDYNCMRNIQNLKRIIIPASVTSICINAFDLPDDDGVELYFCGTEEQWKEIVVWTPAMSLGGDHYEWAVSDFDWLANPYSDNAFADIESWVKAIHFNVDPSTLEDLVPEEEEPQQSVFDQIFAPVKQFFASVISFFKMVVSWFNFGK